MRTKEHNNKIRLGVLKAYKEGRVNMLLKSINSSLWQIGKTLSVEHKLKISNALKGKIVNRSTREKLRLSRLGKKLSKETINKIIEARARSYKKENHYNWKGGISFEPYSTEFTYKLKEQIRNRDGRKCQLCGVPEIECIRKLDIHHINYNKTDCSVKNLISLCHVCNAKVNFNRKEWTKYFEKNNRRHNKLKRKI